jgi:hypothetical protein
LDIYYNTIIILQYSSGHILPYTLKLILNLSIPHLFVKIVLAPHYSTKMSCTCHDMFTGIQK